MAEERIVGKDGSVTIIHDSFSPYGQRLVGLSEPPDDPRRYEVPSLDEAPVCERYGCTPDDLVAWRPYGFPEPTQTRRKTRFGSWKVSVVRSWNVSVLERWEAAIVELAERIPQR
jgi:hypothetical protein